MEKSRYLILSANVETWKFDRPVVFLGEWCRLYERKNIWQPMDGIVASPYGIDYETKTADFAEASAIEARLFPRFCLLLNEHHKIAHSERFWQIILGHWFRRVIDIVINRYKTLDLCLERHEVSGCTVYRNYDNLLVTPNSDEFNNAADSDIWNHALFSVLINYFENKITRLDFIEEERITICADDQLHSSSSTAFNGIKKSILSLADKSLRFFKCFSRPSDPFIIGSYLPIWSVITLHLMLGRFPQLPISPRFESNSVTNIDLRKNFSDRFAIHSGEYIEMVISSLIPRLLPKCYLEDFDGLCRISSGVNWPEEPMFIFTSNNFDADEIFKCWVAHKVEQGYKYYVGQHGSSYGVTIDSKDRIEEFSSSRFFTWGWSEGPKYSKVSVLTLIGRRRRKHNPRGGIALIELSRYSRLYRWDSYAEYSLYFAEQLKFVSALDDSLRKRLTVRLHPNSRLYKWNNESKFLEFDSKIILDKGDRPIDELIRRSRLLVFTYDSTTMLEALAHNIPSLIFWRNGLDNIRESALPFYQLLVDAGILYFSGDLVAKKINSIWSDVGGWWGGEEVQLARSEFCKHYARLSATPLRDLVVALRE